MPLRNRQSFVRTIFMCGFLLLTIIFAAEQNAQAAILIVTSNGDQTINTAGCNDGCTLREAIAAASSGDIINFDADLAGKTITLNGTEIAVNKTLTIVNTNLPLVAVSGNHKSRVFNVTADNVEVNGLIVMNGRVGTPSAIEEGGGILVNAVSFSLKNCILTGNNASWGGGISGGGVSTTGGGTITNSTISGNSAGPFGPPLFKGGGIYGAWAITNSTISGNTVFSNTGGGDVDGGGISGNCTVTNSTISGNTAENRGSGNAKGGGISGNCTITSSTISGNTVLNFTGASTSLEGGGIWGDCTIANSTISGNTMPTDQPFGSPNRGAGIFGGGTITNSTISGNSGGDAIYYTSPLSLKNTIVAQNGISDVGGSGTLTSNGNNLIGNNQNVTTQFPAGNPNANNDYVGTSASPLNALLDTLKGNFGDTATHALLSGSLALNNGNNMVPAIKDQRGFPRIQGGTIDIGAFESSGAVTIARVTLPDGLTGINYDENTGAAGGTLPYTFSFTGTPPPGLNINMATGRITGMPTTAGNFTFGVQVQDSTALRGRNGKASKTALAPNVAEQKYQIQVFAPTAAAVNLRGRVLTFKGRGLTRALVVLTDSAGETKVYTTNQFGYFNFAELRAGETYILEAYRKGYEFQARLVTMKDSITNFEMTPVP